jgi:hypothetical protein
MVAVDHAGLYDLHDLGRKAPIVLSDRHRKSDFVPFRITKEAHEKYPYARVFLRFRIRIATRTTKGFGYVTMKTGHGSSASAEFLTRRKNGRLRISWNTVTVDGQSNHSTTRRTIKVNYPNYMLFDDATAGKHRLRFELERYRGFHVDWVKISPSSGIELTARSPYAAKMRVSAKTLSPGPPRVGRPMTVAVRVTNTGDQAATNVPVDLEPDRGLRVVGAEAHRTWRVIRAGKTVERRVRIVPLTAGRHALGVSAGSSSRPVSGNLVFTTEKPAARGSNGDPPLWVWIAVGAALAGLASWRIRRVAPA